MKSKSYIQFAFIFGVYFLGACSAVKFSKNYDCTSDGSCVVQNGKAVYPSETKTVDGGKVDLLIVTDNSASMSFEQNRMAQRFNLFLNNLESKQIDYRIAFITTDVSSAQNPPRAINKNGDLQDGRLISLSNGKKYLTKADGDLNQKVAIFNAAIKRQETLNCESFITNWLNAGKSMEDNGYSSAYLENCPSPDERGIYATNLVINNNPESFLRDDADFHLIILSDEDERSQLYLTQTEYTLDSQDIGKNLATNIRARFPNKNFGIHPIITADEYCLPIQNQQFNNLVKGSYGTQYNEARKQALSIMNSERAAKGLANVQMVLGDICQNDYASQLQTIFNNVSGPIVDNFALKCANPEGLTVTVSSSDNTVTHEVVGNVIKFNKKLPVGSTVNISSYSCNE